MAVKKKEKITEERASAQMTQMTQMISVDAGKLSKGLKTTFEGVAMVFDSIGVPVDIGASVDDGASVGAGYSAEKKEEKTEASPVAEAESGTAPVEVTQKKEPEKPVQEESAPATKAKAAGTESTEDTENKEAKEAPVEKPVPESSITIDDITKIIVQKIKQNRKNNEKIGSILRAYQVSKVSDLSTSKYEAFLTDLSAI